MKKLDKAEEELTKSGQGVVSITDSESRFMENKKKRKETVEWPFGNIKQNMKFREFYTRGIENVRI